MEMILRHGDITSKLLEESLCCYSKSLQSPPSSAGKYVLVPDGMHCSTCYKIHGYPSHELTQEESEQFLQLLERCPCFCAHIELPRHWTVIFSDIFNKYFDQLERKFGSLEELMIKIQQKLQEKSWKLGRLNETVNDVFSVSPLFQKLSEMPEGILEDCKAFFHGILDFLYENELGFVKGKYLAVSIELLFRYCEGDINLFLNHLSQACSLVQSQYCSISRMAIEAGFWQVCPEFGGFFWKNIDFKINFPFLKEFVEEKMIFIRNFSLSMGPHYLIGGGYFSYIYNIKQDLVVWYLPNFWHEDYFGFKPEER